MMVCRLMIEGNEENYVVRKWLVGREPPFEGWELESGEQVSILADGEEYDYIFSSFRDMPIPYEHVQIRGTITPRGKSVVFYGDMAKFILGNL